MNEMPNAIADLIAKYLKDELNDQEKQELDNWVQQSEEHQRFFRQFTDEETLAATLTEYETSKSIVYSKIKEAIPFSGQTKTKTMHGWWLYPRKLTAVEASLIITAGLLFWWQIDKKEKSGAATATVQPTQDRQPASEGAILKLDDGKEIILDH